LPVSVVNRSRSAGPEKIRRAILGFFRDNSLSLAFLLLFFASLYLQSLTGVYAYDREHAAHPLGYWGYLKTGTFLDGLFINWEAALLQLGTLIVLSAFLEQRGAAHSRQPAKSGHRPLLKRRHSNQGTPKLQDDQRGHSKQRRQLNGKKQQRIARQGGVLSWLYDHSLSLAFFLLFLATFCLHVVYGTEAYNETMTVMHQPRISTIEYLCSAGCWFQTFQTWEAEFFAIGLYVVRSISLREKGSAESKTPEESNQETGIEED
jgi:Domain of unknown function (DUF6766)